MDRMTSNHNIALIGSIGCGGMSCSSWSTYVTGVLRPASVGRRGIQAHSDMLLLLAYAAGGGAARAPGGEAWRTSPSGGAAGGAAAGAVKPGVGQQQQHLQ